MLAVRQVEPVEPIQTFLAGPVYVPESSRRAMLVPVVEHRSEEFRATWKRLEAGLKSVFRTEQEVLIATGSATLFLEAAVASLVDGPLLVLSCGAFSERWLEIARCWSKEVDRLEVPWGEVHDPDRLRRALQAKRYAAVAMVHSETSTGVLEPVSDLARVVRESSEALVLVDAVSSLAAAQLETDAWGLDLVVSGSQKGLAAPPGLAVAALSRRALERACRVRSRGFYLDLVRYAEEQRRGGPITTPAVSVCFALASQLDRIEAEGLEARWARHRACAEQVAFWASGNGVPLAGPPEHRSPALSCLLLPPGQEAGKLRTALTQEGYRISGGYGAWRQTSVRIGHLGEVRPSDLEPMLKTLEKEWKRWLAS